MAEYLQHQNYEVPREQLLTTAEQLFSFVASESEPEAKLVSLTDFVPLGLEGIVPPEIEEAVGEEFLRAGDEECERMRVRKAQWEAQRKQRSLARRVLDTIQGSNSNKLAARHTPKYDINSVYTYRQETSGYLSLYGADDWAKVSVQVTRAWFDGDITIAGQKFILNPDHKKVSIELGYPDDENNRNLFIEHSVFPFIEGIKTSKEQDGLPRSDINNIPHRPFTQKPADPSVYMMRAMEMLIEAKNTAQEQS